MKHKFKVTEYKVNKSSICEEFWDYIFEHKTGHLGSMTTDLRWGGKESAREFACSTLELMTSEDYCDNDVIVYDHEKNVAWERKEQSTFPTISASSGNSIANFDQETFSKYVNEAMNQAYKDMIIFGESFTTMGNFPVSYHLKPYQTEINRVAEKISAEICKEIPKESWDGPVPSCIHEWKNYVGLTQRYNYCIKCDQKQDV